MIVLDKYRMSRSIDVYIIFKYEYTPRRGGMEDEREGRERDREEKK